jgi:hypothetical protein
MIGPNHSMVSRQPEHAIIRSDDLTNLASKVLHTVNTAITTPRLLDEFNPSAQRPTDVPKVPQNPRPLNSGMRAGLIDKYATRV